MSEHNMHRHDVRKMDEFVGLLGRAGTLDLKSIQLFNDLFSFCTLFL